MKTLIVMTNNVHKLKEIREILTDVQVVGYKEVVGETVEVVEDGETFEENAIKKAEGIPLQKDAYILAEDSGIEVAALGGLPGIHSARFAGEESDDEDNNDKLLAMLADKDDRSAQYRAVMALRSPDGNIQIFEGTCKGSITHQRAGTNGFGYDPLFIPEGYDKTFGELGETVKHELSHRGQALRKMIDAQ